MITRLQCPKLSANVEEATVTAWYRSAGDTVRKGEPLLELTTDKTAHEIEAPRAGVLRRVLADCKSVVPVGYVLALIGPATEPLPDVAAENAACMAAFRAAGADTGRKPASDKPAAVRATPAARRLAAETKVALAAVQQAAHAEIVTEQMVRDFLDRRTGKRA